MLFFSADFFGENWHRGQITIESRKTLIRLVHTLAETMVVVWFIETRLVLLYKLKLLLRLNLFAQWEEGREHKVWHLDSLSFNSCLLNLNIVVKVLEFFLMILSFLKRNSKQLVLSFCRLDLSLHFIRHYTQVLALLLQVFDMLIILLLDITHVLEFVLVQLQLILEVNYPAVLSELVVLLFRFLL